MASNAFGTLFKITTWGESHGKEVGVVIDGSPPGIEIDEEEINQELSLRRPGRSSYVSPRNEADRAEILSGVFEGKTTGAPIAIRVKNRDVDSSKYDPIKKLLRPGHANGSYLEKYGLFDHRGGGRASARETVGRVAASTLAKKILYAEGVYFLSYLQNVGGYCTILSDLEKPKELADKTKKSPIFCPDEKAEEKILSLLKQLQQEGDSIGGVVEVIAFGVPLGLGDPIYEKVEAKLASALLSLPASKGFEIGSGFSCVTMRGSEHNDSYYEDKEGSVKIASNHSGGVLGGITTGEPLVCRVAFKPTSSIRKTQKTVDLSGKDALFQLPVGSRHDPCVAIRAVPIVEAMVSLVLVDSLLMQRAVGAVQTSSSFSLNRQKSLP